MKFPTKSHHFFSKDDTSLYFCRKVRLRLSDAEKSSFSFLKGIFPGNPTQKRDAIRKAKKKNKTSLVLNQSEGKNN
ncbi:hypothetical protein [Bacteroides cellulosilyticus]|uniref:hypothetical protein n=1 Tax=Bacteroides cellulosilyticus TaxID=246787 RepID=UPI0022E56E24|nr:hypothetical protein [Bacteroides cellulosilyticus]